MQDAVLEVGNWYTKVENTEEITLAGPYGLENRNNTGELQLNFCSCQSYHFFFSNIIFIQICCPLSEITSKIGNNECSIFPCFCLIARENYGTFKINLDHRIGYLWIRLSMNKIFILEQFPFWPLFLYTNRARLVQEGCCDCPLPHIVVHETLLKTCFSFWEVTKLLRS